MQPTADSIHLARYEYLVTGSEILVHLEGANTDRLNAVFRNGCFLVYPHNPEEVFYNGPEWFAYPPGLALLRFLTDDPELFDKPVQRVHRPLIPGPAGALFAAIRG